MQACDLAASQLQRNAPKGSVPASAASSCSSRKRNRASISSIPHDGILRTFEATPSQVASGGSHPCARAYLTIRWASVSGIIPVENRAQLACFQVAVETLVHQTFAEPCMLLPNRFSQAAHWHKLAARTMAGAHSSEAAAPMNMLLRVIKPSWLETGAVIEPSCKGEGLLCYVCRRNGHIPSRLRGNHLAAVWQVGEGASPSLDELFIWGGARRLQSGASAARS